MKTVKIITLTFFIGIGGILFYATTRPDSFRVERSVDIKAPAAKIFPYVNDLRKSVE